MQAASLLNAVRVNRIFQGLVDPRLLPQQLIWSRRVPSVRAMDEEIMARVIGVTDIADLIADDAQAVIRTGGRVQLEAYKLPNIKTGIGFNQTTLNLFANLNAGVLSDQQLDVLKTRITQAIASARLGVAQRIEYLIRAMLCDGVGYSYDRLGIKLTTPTWGTWSDLKITAGTTWDVAATATPVADLWAARTLAKRRYGANLTRVTMSTPAFQLMIATTEFQNKSRMYLAPNVSYTNLTISNLDQQRVIAQNTLGFAIEFDDAQFWQESTAGVKTSIPATPLGNVILTDPANDGNADVWDFANGQITESIVASILGGNGIGMIGDLNQAYGPAAYATSANANLNPPGVNVWAVARGWPRKHQLAASAVLNIGTVTDTISTSLPF